MVRLDCGPAEEEENWLQRRGKKEREKETPYGSKEKPYVGRENGRKEEGRILRTLTICFQCPVNRGIVDPDSAQGLSSGKGCA